MLRAPGACPLFFLLGITDPAGGGHSRTNSHSGKDPSIERNPHHYYPDHHQDVPCHFRSPTHKKRMQKAVPANCRTALSSLEPAGRWPALRGRCHRPARVAHRAERGKQPLHIPTRTPGALELLLVPVALGVALSALVLLFYLPLRKGRDIPAMPDRSDCH